MTFENDQDYYLNISNANITNSDYDNTTDEFEPDEEIDYVFRALSYACTAISIVCLCIHITVYFLLPPLQTVPAKMVIFMSIGWIVAELLEIIDENIEPTYLSCYIIGVIQQYVYLSIFAWTNIMAFDVQRSFRCKVQSVVSRCRFIAYNLYAWCFPATIAIASVTVYIEIARSVNMALFFCYYGSPLYALITCAVVFPMLFANGVMFAIAVCFLCKTARETRMAANSKNREYFGLCVKLAIVLGLPWFPLLIFSFTESKVMSGIAEIFVGLHGVYVFLIFTCKKKTWRLLKKRFGSKKEEVNTTESISLKQLNYVDKEIE